MDRQQMTDDFTRYDAALTREAANVRRLRRRFISRVSNALMSHGNTDAKRDKRERAAIYAAQDAAEQLQACRDCVLVCLIGTEDDPIMLSAEPVLYGGHLVIGYDGSEPIILCPGCHTEPCRCDTMPPPEDY